MYLGRLWCPGGAKDSRVDIHTNPLLLYGPQAEHRPFSGKCSLNTEPNSESTYALHAGPEYTLARKLQHLLLCCLVENSSQNMQISVSSGQFYFRRPAMSRVAPTHESWL